MAEELEGSEGLQMSFLDHLDELRRRLIHSVLAITIGFVISYALSGYIYDFLSKPVKEQIRLAKVQAQTAGGQDNVNQLTEGALIQYTFAQDSALGKVNIALGTTVPAKIVKQPDGKLAAVTAQPWVIGKTVIPQNTPLTAVFGKGELPGFGPDEKLVITTVGGAFTLYMKVAMYAAVALAIPFLIYQIWAFIAPGLYRHEKKYVTPLLLMAVFFFVAGAAFAYKVAFPAACNYLLGLQYEGDFHTLINAEDYFDLITMIMLGLGIVFQIPTVAFLLGRIGLVTPGLLWKGWRYAVVIIAIIAAVLTPTADAFNMLIFAAPMFGLYFLSIGIVWLFGKPRRTDAEVDAYEAGR